MEDRIFERLLDGVRAVLDDMANDRGHGMRRASSTSASSSASTSCRPHRRCEPGASSSPATCSSGPELRTWVASVWTDAKAHLRDQASDPMSDLHRQVGDAIASGGQRMLAEPALVDKVDEVAESAARYVVEHFGGEITELVSSTIARWDGEETSNRLELLLGPDLQFIRINGTVVGGLAGLGLHALAQLLG